MPDDLRADIAAAHEKLSVEPAPAPATEAPAPVGVDTPTEPTPSEGIAPQPTVGGRERDEQGRFVPKDTAKPAVQEKAPSKAPGPATAGQGGVTEPVSVPPVLSDLKPPQSWKPAAREKWGKLERDVQEEILRREKDQKAFEMETAEPRKEWKAFKETIAPYEHMIRASGLTPHQAVGNLLQRYAALQTAPLPVRAQIIAQLQRDFLGTDESAIGLLASALEGAGKQAPAQQGFSPEQIRAMVQEQLRAERAQSEQQATAAMVQQFEASEPEFLHDVEEEMAGLIGVERQRNPGKAWTLERLKGIYDKACLLNESVSSTLKQREAAKAAKNAQASTERARNASSSVQSRPAGGVATPAGDGSIRADLEAAYAAMQRR